MAKKTSKKKAPASKPMMAEMMKPMNNDKNTCSCEGSWCNCGPWAMTLLRVVIAGIFIQAGITKLQLGPAILGMTWFGYLLGVVELLAGIALLVGYKTFWAGKTVAVIMLGALIIVHRTQFGTPGFYYPLMLLVGAAVLAHYGPGKWAIDNKCGCGVGCGRC